VSDPSQYALVLLLVSGAGLLSVLANRLTERVKVPAPLLLLVCSAVAVAVVPTLHAPPEQTVEHLVTAALVLILFDGGMHIGWQRFRAAAVPIGVVGVVGTFATTAATASLLHWVLGLGWYPSVLIATAVAPTDPAVVFSVLGRRQIRGRSSTILEGESGANDPVGIALMIGLLAAGGLSAPALGQVGLTFLLQMGIGLAAGVVGGRALLVFMRRVPLPSEALYPLRTLACAFILFGATTLAHGSGFLAVFVAGIVIGDGRAPYKREVERFHSALASLGEIVAFVALGLAVDVGVLVRGDVLWPGLVVGVVLAALIRPVVIGACLAPARLAARERQFVLFAGLKGAVPILLALMLRSANVPGAERLFGIVVVVVVFSVLVQGSLVPTLARLLRLPMRMVEPEPWSIGVRLRDEPGGVHRLRVAQGSRAEGSTVDDLGEVADDLWVSIVVRDSQLVQVRPATRLRSGDDVVVLADQNVHGALTAAFAKHPDDVPGAD
jgi:cell volume regulation protein A